MRAENPDSFAVAELLATFVLPVDGVVLKTADVDAGDEARNVNNTPLINPTTDTKNGCILPSYTVFFSYKCV